jgi:hypothetical protein
MPRVCGEPEVGQRVALEWFADDMAWHHPNGYGILVARLTSVSNPEACFITRIEVIFHGPVIRPLPVLDENLERAAAGGHNVVAYVAALLLYLANGGASVGDTAR